MKYTLDGTSMLLVFKVHVKMPGVPRVALGVKALVEVLKLNVVGVTGLGLEMEPPPERQSDSRAAPVWQADRNWPLIFVFSDDKMRLKGFDVSL